jgi:hypothetical protein
VNEGEQKDNTNDENVNTINNGIVPLNKQKDDCI